MKNNNNDDGNSNSNNDNNDNNDILVDSTWLDVRKWNRIKWNKIENIEYILNFSCVASQYIGDCIMMLMVGAGWWNEHEHLLECQVVVWW